MKRLNNGFITPLILIMIAFIVIGSYFYYKTQLVSSKIPIADSTMNRNTSSSTQDTGEVAPTQDETNAAKIVGTTAILRADSKPGQLWNPNYTIPKDAVYISFDFMWNTQPNGSWLVVQFNDNLLLNFPDSVTTKGEVMHSGPVPVSEHTGETGQLLFTLNSKNSVPAEVTISNLTTSFSSANH